MENLMEVEIPLEVEDQFTKADIEDQEEPEGRREAETGAEGQ